MRLFGWTIVASALLAAGIAAYTVTSDTPATDGGTGGTGGAAAVSGGAAGATAGSGGAAAGAAGSTAGAGGGSTTCDVEADAGACDKCAAQKCCPEFLACASGIEPEGGSATCPAALTCLNGCTKDAAACLTECVAESGYSENYNNLTICVIGDSNTTGKCASECAAADGG
jgi:hypothetical protein